MLLPVCIVRIYMPKKVESKKFKYSGIKISNDKENPVNMTGMSTAVRLPMYLERLE